MNIHSSLQELSQWLPSPKSSSVWIKVATETGFSMNLILYHPSFCLLPLRKLLKKLILPFHVCNLQFQEVLKTKVSQEETYVAHIWANIRTYVWVGIGEGSHATVGIATSSTVTSLCIPLACVKTIFNQLRSVADGLALASETPATNGF